MKRLALLFALVASPALAQQPIPVPSALSVREAIAIANALTQMNCAQRVIKDGAKESFVCEPYGTDKLKVGLAWQIAKSQSRLGPIVRTYQSERNRMLGAAERKPDGNLTEKAQAKFLADEAEMLDASSGVTLDHFKREEIERLNLEPSAIADLLPIIDDK